MITLNKKELGLLTIFSVVIMNFGPIALSISIAINMLTLYWHYTSSSKGNIRPLLVSLIIPLSFVMLAIFTIYVYQGKVKVIMYVAIFIYLNIVTLAVLYFFYIGLDEVKRAFKLFITISFCIILLQQLTYIVIGKYIDFHYILTAFQAESRYRSPLLESIGMIRPTGWTVEPSNMSAIITFSTIIYYLIISKVDRVVILGLATAIITFSFASIIIVALIILLISIRSLSLSKLMIFSTPLVFVLSYFVYYRLTGGVGYDSLGMRMQIVNIILSQDIGNILFGNGFFALQAPLNINNYLVYDYNIRDSGLWPNLLFSIGFIPTSFVICLLYLLIRNKTEFTIVFFALFSKFDYFQPFFWFFILMLIGFYINGFKKEYVYRVPSS